MSVALGLLAQMGLLWIWALSAGVGIAMSYIVKDGLALLLPAGVVGAFAGGIHAYPGTGRRLGMAGMTLAGAAVAGLAVVLLFAG